jgi:hypothetical protein
MYDPIRMNNEIQPEKDINVEVLDALNQIQRNTKVIKGWVTFFGILVLIVLIGYLVITLVGAAAFLNLFSGILR